MAFCSDLGVKNSAGPLVAMICVPVNEEMTLWPIFLIIFWSIRWQPATIVIKPTLEVLIVHITGENMLGEFSVFHALVRNISWLSGNHEFQCTLYSSKFDNEIWFLGLDGVFRFSYRITSIGSFCIWCSYFLPCSLAFLAFCWKPYRVHHAVELRYKARF